jgi:hypothetical protein
MSEFTINLALGLVGTITGVIALFISWWTFNKDKPKLKISVIECSHNFIVSQTGDRKTVSFWVDFLIKNIGYRGTTIEDVELFFENDGKPYKMLKQNYIRDFSQQKRISVSPSQSFDLSPDFHSEFFGKEEDTIKCTFTVFHTYKAETVKHTSVRKKSN